MKMKAQMFTTCELKSSNLPVVLIRLCRDDGVAGYTTGWSLDNLISFISKPKNPGLLILSLDASADEEKECH